MTAKAANPFQAPLYVLIFGTLFGATISMAKLGGQYGLNPITLVFWQMLLGGILLLITALARGQSLRLNRRYLRYYFIAGLVGNAIPTTLAFVASLKIGAALTGLVYPLSPLTTYAFSIIIGIDAIRKHKVAGMALGLLGAAAIVVPPLFSAPDLATDTPPILWLALAFSIPIFLGIANIYRSMDWPQGASSISLAAGMLLATTILMIPLFFFVDAPVWPEFTSMVPIAIFVGNIIMSYVGFIFYFELQRIADPVYFSQISYFITITTMVFGYVLFGETIHWYVVPSVVLIFAGLFLVSRKQK